MSNYGKGKLRYSHHRGQIAYVKGTYAGSVWQLIKIDGKNCLYCEELTI